jgi:hypothetical protein
MALNRTHVAAAFAGTLSLVALTGCPGVTPTGTNPSAAPSAAASAAASATPGAAASATPATSGSSAPGAATSAAPSVAISAPPPGAGSVVVVSGMVYDEKYATVDGATVTFRSLDKSVPYEATVQTTAGSYVLNNVPEGANVEAVVTKAGWTSRRRVQSFQKRATGEKNTLNFGAARTTVTAVTYSLAQVEATVPDGAAYFISNYPEIAATTPEHDAKGLDPSKLAIKVTLSEPLDEDSRDAFDDAFHIVPANAQAAAKFVDVAALETTTNSGQDDGVQGAFDPTTAFSYTLSEGNTFLGSTRNRVRAMWNPAGTEVVYTFEGGNLQTDDNDPAEYQAVLFAGGEKVEDADGNQLGTNDHGAFEWPGAGVICNAFKDTELTLAPLQIAPYRLFNGTTYDTVWGQTHQTAVSFEFKEDEVDPKLMAVDLVEDEDDVRIQLTFSEPMAAYKGSGLGTVSPSIYYLRNYSFMLGAKAGDLDGESLDGGIQYNSATDLDGGTPDFTAEQEFSFVADESIGAYEDGAGSPTLAGVGKDLDGAQGATVAIEVDPDAPTNVNIWIRNGRTMFEGFRTIKARVEGVSDPSGNSITGTDADRNLVNATI